MCPRRFFISTMQRSVTARCTGEMTIRRLKSSRIAIALILVGLVGTIVWLASRQQPPAPGLAFRHVPGTRTVYELEYLGAAVSNIDRLVGGQKQPAPDASDPAPDKNAYTVYTEV